MSGFNPCDQLVAHRGHAAAQPENTLPAFAEAIALGATAVETDVQLSRDGVPVLFHDRDLRRLCGREGAVHEHPAAALTTFPVRHPAGGPPAPIPTLAGFVEWLAAAPGVLVFVELKRVSLERFGAGPVLDAVLPLLAPLAGRCVLISYDLAALAQARARARAAFPVGAVFDDWADHTSDAVQALDADWWLCAIDTLPPTGTITHPGRHLAVYECTDPARARDVLNRGVDRVETFAIGHMLKALAAGDGG